MNQERPLFTVAVITYLQRNFLDECLDSIFSQTYPNIEIVVCDDNSADFDVDSVRKYIEENKRENIKRVVVYKQEHNVGTVVNAQKAVELCTGVYFKLHAGDDLLYDERVLDKMAVHFRDSDINIIAARSIACQHDGTMTNDYYPSYEAVFNMMKADAEKQFRLIGTQSWGEYINAPAVFWKRDFFDVIGGFDLSYKYTEDWPMWLKITRSGYRITSVNEVTTVYRYGGISNDASGLNVTLGRTHYLECIRMMREYVLPKFEAEHSKMMVFRCKQCIRCIQTRILCEENWSNWSNIQRIAWRIKNVKFLTTSWMYRKKKVGAAVQARGQFIAMAICVFLYMFHVQMWPGVPCDTIWAVAFFIGAIWLLWKICFVLGIRLMNLLIENVKGKE